MTGGPTRLRATTEEDLDAVLRTEAGAEVAPYVGTWTRARHLRAIADPAEAHLIFEREEARGGVPLGYVLLSGLDDPNRSLELRRIVSIEQGRGHGRAALALLLRRAFSELGFHRVWLDVLVENERARRAYRASGFVEEGVLRDAFLDAFGFHSLVVMSVLCPEWERGAGQLT